MQHVSMQSPILDSSALPSCSVGDTQDVCVLKGRTTSYNTLFLNDDRMRGACLIHLGSSSTPSNQSNRFNVVADRSVSTNYSSCSSVSETFMSIN